MNHFTNRKKWNILTSFKTIYLIKKNVFLNYSCKEFVLSLTSL